MMQQINMTLDIFGGEKMSAPFLALAQNLAGREETYELFHKDTGKDLGDLLPEKNTKGKKVESLVSTYLDWVAMRYWGIQAHPMQVDDVEDAYYLIHGLMIPDSKFIKSSKEHIESLVDESLVIKQSGKLVGVILMKGNYIDTVATTMKGMGTHLVASLPNGKYMTNVSATNKNSLKMFIRFNMKHIKDEVIEGQERGLYEIEVKHD